jgi:superoxide dismutase, Fe-Mn family
MNRSVVEAAGGRAYAGADLSRRSILAGAAVIGAIAFKPDRGLAAAVTTVKLGKSPVARLPLPFADDALAPVISADTIGFHYGKHHKAYVDNTIKAIAGTPLADASLEEIILATANDPGQVGLFNNAAQAWNHNFYWRSLSARAQAPSGKLKDAIDRDFGGTEALKKALAASCTGQFGSGWGWLILDGGRLKTVATGNAGNPILQDQTPLLTVDVWEHAYYLDYQNRRSDYVTALLDKTLNWEFAAGNFAAA